MKKFLFPLAAFAALSTGNLFAQEAALSNYDAPASAYDCVQENKVQDRSLDVQGAVMANSFTACTNGTLANVALTLKGATDNTWFLAEIRDASGNILDDTRFTSRNIRQNVLVLDLEAEVKNGANYSLQITSPENGRISYRYEHGPMGTLVNDGSPVRGKLTAAFGFNDDKFDQIEAQYEGRGGNAQPETRGLANECKVAVNGHDNRISLSESGQGIAQSFQTCATGELTHITIAIQRSFEDFSGRALVMNGSGDILYVTDLDSRDIVKGTLSMPLDLEVNAGEELTVAVKVLGESRLGIFSNSNGNAGSCAVNGVEVDANVEFTAFISEVRTGTPQDLEAASITTFPNPFADRISVHMKHAPEGKVVVQLLDFSGNVLRSDMLFVEDSEGNITFNTRDIERPGYYALRIIQGDQVKNMTILKR
jgi:hypothetical protein